MTLRLRDLEAPLDDVELPNGTKHQPVPFGPEEYRLWREARESQDPVVIGRNIFAIVRACYPTATEDDLDSCWSPTGRILYAMAAHAGGKIEQVKAQLKNVDAAAQIPRPSQETAPPPTPSPSTEPLSPKMNGDTSSPKSRKRSDKSGGASTTASLTAAPS